MTLYYKATRLDGEQFDVLYGPWASVIGEWEHTT